MLLWGLEVVRFSYKWAMSVRHGGRMYIQTESADNAMTTHDWAQSIIIAWDSNDVLNARHSPAHLALGSLACIRELTLLVHFATCAEGTKHSDVNVDKQYGRFRTVELSEPSWNCNKDLMWLPGSIPVWGKKMTRKWSWWSGVEDSDANKFKYKNSKNVVGVRCERTTWWRAQAKRAWKTRRRMKTEARHICFEWTFPAMDVSSGFLVNGVL